MYLWNYEWTENLLLYDWEIAKIFCFIIMVLCLCFYHIFPFRFLIPLQKNGLGLMYNVASFFPVTLWTLKKKHQMIVVSSLNNSCLLAVIISKLICGNAWKKGSII